MTWSSAERLQRIGAAVLRWSLASLLLFFGALKWTAAEAQAILPFMLNSPLLAWLERAFEPQHASELIGVIEVTIAVLIALRQWAPRLTMIGGLLAIGMFLTTLSFLVTRRTWAMGRHFC